MIRPIIKRVILEELKDTPHVDSLRDAVAHVLRGHQLCGMNEAEKVFIAKVAETFADRLRNAIAVHNLAPKHDRVNEDDCKYP